MGHRHDCPLRQRPAPSLPQWEVFHFCSLLTGQIQSKPYTPAALLNSAKYQNFLKIFKSTEQKTAQQQFPRKGSGIAAEQNYMTLYCKKQTPHKHKHSLGARRALSWRAASTGRFGHLGKTY